MGDRAARSRAELTPPHPSGFESVGYLAVASTYDLAVLERIWPAVSRLQVPAEVDLDELQLIAGEREDLRVAKARAVAALGLIRHEYLVA